MFFFFNLTEIFLTSHCKIESSSKVFGKSQTFLLCHTAFKRLSLCFLKKRETFMGGNYDALWKSDAEMYGMPPQE